MPSQIEADAGEAHCHSLIPPLHLPMYYIEQNKDCSNLMLNHDGWVLQRRLEVIVAMIRHQVLLAEQSTARILAQMKTNKGLSSLV